MQTKDGGKSRGLVWRRIMAASASTIALTASTAVFAQDAQPSNDVEEVIVTGSRIARTDVDTVRPASSIGPEILDKRAFTNLADALKEMPSIGVGIGPNGDQNAFTVGQSYVDLFNLGTQRTLTLVNGRRFVSSNVPSNFSSAGGLQVDYNVLPVALLERIEIVPLAGAAVYGSDAIAGTINVILKDNFEGFDVSAQWGRSGHNDLDQRQIQGVLGTNFADGRGNVAFSVEYNKQDGALLAERPKWSDNRPLVIPFGLRLDADGDGDKDQEYRIYYNQSAQIFGPYGSVSPAPTLLPSLGLGAIGGKFYQFTQTGDLAACTPGVTPGASSALFVMSATPGSVCGLDLVGVTSQIRSPVERINISTLGHYDVTDNVRFFVESTFANSNAKELVNQGGFNSFAFGSTSGALTLNTSNPFLSTSARSVLEGGLGPNANFAVNRLNNDLVSGGANLTQNFTWRVATGFKGDFELADRKFNWEASSVFGKANVQADTLGIIDGRFTNAIDAVRVDTTYLNGLVSAPGSTIRDRNADGLVNAADALIALQLSGQSGVQGIAAGSIVCRVNGQIANGTVQGFNTPVSGSGTTSTAYPFAAGCLPLNIFGDASVVNSQATLDFVTGGPRKVTANNEQRVFTASITGEVVQLPAGWLTVNAGVEARREQAVFSPGLGTSVNISRGGFATYTDTGGESRTMEYFGEVLAPVFNKNTDIPFMNLLEFNASVRRVDAKNEDINNLGNGENDSTAYELGGRWSPIQDLIFRGSYAQAIRSPALVELYTPEIGSFSMAQDPCDQRYVGAGLVPDVRRANCVAAGINPSTFISNAVSATIPILTSGNPNLTPEKSKSYTLGAVIQPHWVPRMLLTLDYFHINIADRISGLSLTQVLNACYDSPSYPNSPACSSTLFTRDGANQINFGRTTSLNASNSAYRSLQGRFSYATDVGDALENLRLRRPDGDFGDLQFDVTLLRTLKNELQVLNEQPANPVGTFANPKWRGTFDVTYNLNNFRFFWRTLWQSKPEFLSTDGASYLVDLGPGQETTVATADNIISNKLHAYFMNNVSVQYTLAEKTQIQLSINNVFDYKPKTIDYANASYYAGDQIGRYFILRVRQQF